MKKCKEKNEKSQKRETVGAVTHTHTHTHKHNLKDTVGAPFAGIDTTVPIKTIVPKGNNQIKSKRTYRYMPLIVMSKLVAERFTSLFAYYQGNLIILQNITFR